MKAPVRVALAGLLAVIAGWIAFRLVPKPLPELTRQEFLAEVREGQLREQGVEVVFDRSVEPTPP